MRIALLAATAAAAFLGGCGGPETSQANNAQANISNSASPPATANQSASTNAMVMLATAPNKDQALRIMKQRHDAMEGLGKAMKAMQRALDCQPARHQCRPRADRHDGIDRGEDPEPVPGRHRARRRQDRAKPEIWKTAGLFARKSKDFLGSGPDVRCRGQGRTT